MLHRHFADSSSQWPLAVCPYPLIPFAPWQASLIIVAGVSIFIISVRPYSPFLLFLFLLLLMIHFTICVLVCLLNLTKMRSIACELSESVICLMRRCNIFSSGRLLAWVFAHGKEYPSGCEYMCTLCCDNCEWKRKQFAPIFQEKRKWFIVVVVRWSSRTDTFPIFPWSFHTMGWGGWWRTRRP